MKSDEFFAYVGESGTIYRKGMGGQPDQKLGLNYDKIAAIESDRDAAFDKATKYLNELYDVGTASQGVYGRVRPKSPEQVSAEQTQINQQILRELKELRRDIDDVRQNKKPGSGHNSNAREAGDQSGELHVKAPANPKPDAI